MRNGLEQATHQNGQSAAEIEADAAATSTEVSLPDGDYILTDGDGWFTVKGMSVRIKSTAKGVMVDIYPLHRELDDALARCYAFDAEAAEALLEPEV